MAYTIKRPPQNQMSIYSSRKEYHYSTLWTYSRQRKIIMRV